MSSPRSCFLEIDSVGFELFTITVRIDSLPEEVDTAKFHRPKIIAQRKRVVMAPLLAYRRSRGLALGSFDPTNLRGYDVGTQRPPDARLTGTSSATLIHSECKCELEIDSIQRKYGALIQAVVLNLERGIICEVHAKPDRGPLIASRVDVNRIVGW